MLRGVARAVGLTGVIGLFAFFLPAPCWAALPTVVQVVPASGASAPDQWVSFTATYRDSDGWKDLGEVRFLINRRFTSPARAVYLRYNCRNNRLYLLSDRLNASLGGFAPGSPHIIENSQGRLDTAGTTVSGSGQTLTVTWRVSFKPAFAGGPYATSLWAQDRSRSTPLIAKGTWTVDSTAPSIPVVTDDGAYSTSATQLHAAWTSADAQSGIAEYQYAIGTTVGGTDVVNWTSTGTATGVTKAGLTLTNGTKYYFSVKAQNGTGKWSPAGDSDGITVDSTAPSTPVVTDDGAWTDSTTTLHSTWSASDPEFGIAEYQYKITQDSATGTVVVEWTSVGTGTEVTKTSLSLTNGRTYYFSVKAKNGAGTWSGIGSSDGIVVDKNAPVISRVTPADKTAFTEGDLVAMTVAASDADGDPLEYQFLINGVVKRAWASTVSWNWDTRGYSKAHTGTVQVRDGLGRQDEAQVNVYVYLRPIGPPRE